jgi:farnesyl-diphosphate farnesyltransferase
MPARASGSEGESFSSTRLPSKSDPAVLDREDAARLDRILRAVSRSFYLTLRLAPRPLRRALGLGYLFCRAADTIADTRLLAPDERRLCIREFRSLFLEERPPREPILALLGARLAQNAEIPEERELLERLDSVFEAYDRADPDERRRIDRLVKTLTLGMEMDLSIFPAESSGEIGVLEDDAVLDRYCYHVAGCVGEFWSDLAHDRLRSLASWDVERWRPEGVRFGKALQMTNILRDADRDFSIGRVYIPRTRLAAAGIDPSSIVRARNRSVLRPLIHDLLALTLDHYEAAWRYTLSLPRRAPRLRLACALPLWIGLQTLELLARAEDPCAASVRLKIPRSAVQSLLRSAMLRVLSNRALDRRYRELERSVRQAMAKA